MKKDIIMQALTEQKIMLEEMGYKVAGVFLFGSQNYNLDLNNDEYQSDIDVKAIIVPTLDDLVNNTKPVSKKVLSSTGEIDVKDIRVFMETLLKGNPAYLETLFTDYYIIDDAFIDEMKEMIDRREELVKVLRPQLIKSIYGMMLEKEKALCHPYPTTAWKIEKWGFDGKQSSHCLRLYDLAWRYFIFGDSYKNALIPNKVVSYGILKHKLNEVSLEEAINDCKDSISDVKDIKDDYFRILGDIQIDYSIKEDYINLSKKIIRDKIVAEIMINYEKYLEEQYTVSEDK